MKKISTEKTSSSERNIKISAKTRALYEQAKNDPALNNDPDTPILPPEVWAKGVVGKYYRPLKTVISLRVDNDVLAWLKSAGGGHLTRINAILRKEMESER